MRKFCTMQKNVCINNFWSWREKMSSRSCRNPCKSLLQSTFFAFHWQNFFTFHFFKIIIISYHMCSWMHTKFLLQKSYWLNVCTAFCSMPLITHDGFACLLPHIILLWNNSAPLYSDTYMEDHSDFTIIPGSLQRQDWQDPRLPTCTEWKILKIFPTSAAKKTHLTCAICLKQHQHDVLNFNESLTWDQQHPTVSKCTENQNFLLKKGDISLCANWQCLWGCTNTRHDSKHVCSGCGSSAHGAQKCIKCRKLRALTPYHPEVGNTISKLLVSCIHLDILFEDYKLDSKLIFHSLLLPNPPPNQNAIVTYSKLFHDIILCIGRYISPFTKDVLHFDWKSQHQTLVNKFLVLVQCLRSLGWFCPGAELTSQRSEDFTAVQRAYN